MSILWGKLSYIMLNKIFEFLDLWLPASGTARILIGAGFLIFALVLLFYSIIAGRRKDIEYNSDIEDVDDDTEKFIVESALRGDVEPLSEDMVSPFAEELSEEEISRKFNSIKLEVDSIPSHIKLKEDTGRPNLSLMFDSLESLMTRSDMELGPDGMFLDFEPPFKEGTVFDVSVLLSAGHRLVDCEAELKSMEDSKGKFRPYVHFLNCTPFAKKFLIELAKTRT